MALILGATAARAQIVFTFTGKVDPDCSMLGYVGNDPVTFTVRTNSAFGPNSSTFGEGSNKWAEEETTEQQLFTAFSGTGVSGSLTRPSANVNDPFSTLTTTGSHTLSLLISADSDGTQNIGVVAPSSVLIHQFSLTIDTSGSGLSFSTLATYGDPIAYFASRAGTYSGFASSDITLTDVSGGMVEFSVDTMTISAIPEPATDAALLGAVALLAGAWREVRRRKLA